MKKSVIFYNFLILLFIALSCSKTSFVGGTKKNNTSPTKEINQVTVDVSTEKTDDPFESEEGSVTTIPYQAQTLVPVPKYKNRGFWVVTTAKHVYYREFAETGTEIVHKKHWTFSGNGDTGIRTYVTDGAGLVFGQGGGSGPHFYVINPETTPEETNVTPSWSGGSGSRPCFASYDKGGKRYVGIGWNKDGARVFSEFPMIPGDNGAFTIDFSTVPTPYPAGSGSWAYSCYVDQNVPIYYGASNYGALYAFDLNQMKEVKISDSAKNAGHASTVAGDDGTAMTDPAGSGPFPYAISGDPMGNIFIGYSYTYAFSADYTLPAPPKMVWRTSRHPCTGFGGDRKISVYPQSCFVKNETCENYREYTSQEAGLAGLFAGPISSIGRGEVIALTREYCENNGGSSAYLLKLKDPANAAGGIEATKLEQFPGQDAYMYNDFTGATLFIVSVSAKFDLHDEADFDPSLDVVRLSFSYIPANEVDDISDITAEVRCYQKDSDDVPDFEDIDNVAKDPKMKVIEAKSCKGKFDFVEITLKRTKGIFKLTEANQIKISLSQ